MLPDDSVRDVVVPTERIRKNWEEQFDKNKHSIAKVIAKTMTAILFRGFIEQYNNSYKHFPSRLYPYDINFEITPHSVYKILRDNNVKRLAPFKDWQNVRFTKNNEFDQRYFKKKIQVLINEIWHNVLEGILITTRENYNLTKVVKIKVVSDSNNITMKIWAKRRFLNKSHHSPEIEKFHKKTVKHIRITAAKISHSLVDQIRSDIERRKNQPLAIHPSTNIIKQYDLYFGSVLKLVEESIPRKERLSPFKKWIEQSEKGFPIKTDFIWYKDKIIFLFQCIQCELIKQKKQLKQEGIAITSTLNDNRHFNFMIEYHGIKQHKKAHTYL